MIPKGNHHPSILLLFIMTKFIDVIDCYSRHLYIITLSFMEFIRYTKWRNDFINLSCVCVLKCHFHLVTLIWLLLVNLVSLSAMRPRPHSTTQCHNTTILLPLPSFINVSTTDESSNLLLCTCLYTIPMCGRCIGECERNFVLGPDTLCWKLHHHCTFQ